MVADKDMANIPDIFELRTPAQWKAFSHPLRLRILERLAGDALTNEELAAALGERSGKLYFHTKRLLDAGLIVLDRTRQKGPITEKLYRAAARRFLAPPPTLDGDAPPLETALVSALDLYRSDWQESGGLPGELQMGFHMTLPLDEKTRREFARRVKALFEGFQASGSDAPDARRVSLGVLIHSRDTNERKTDATTEDNGAGNGSAGDGGDDR
jgi:DNA-binding transcriptional ArsR family regulator